VSRVLHRSRQSYYQGILRRKQHKDHGQVLMDLVGPIRRLMPRIGGRKLHFMLQEKMKEKSLKIGRDRFFHWLRVHDLLVARKRSYVRTTQSNHRFWIHQNLTKNLAVQKPMQLWVSDITYLRTVEGFCYLALITDAYSRKIVGYDVSDSMELSGCLRALRCAMQTACSLNELIHHSDRGLQYCSDQYTRLLKEKGIKISMATAGDCYENALAERVNGILKDEFNLDTTFKTKAQAIRATHESVYIYNQHRPHWSIDLQTPNERHAA
jgi:transposase InsO family protein